MNIKINKLYSVLKHILYFYSNVERTTTKKREFKNLRAKRREIAGNVTVQIKK